MQSDEMFKMQELYFNYEFKEILKIFIHGLITLFFNLIFRPK